MKKFLSLTLSFLMIFSSSCAYMMPSGRENSEALAAAEYPDMVQYPDGDSMDGYDNWHSSRDVLRWYEDDISANYIDYVIDSTRVIMQDDTVENLVYSPMSLYMALAMLAETTGGNSRQEVLDLLQSDSIEELRVEAQALFLSSYIDDGVSKSLLANSLWTNNLAIADGLEYKDETLNFIAEQYYADVFSGDMGDPHYDKLLQDWINEKTGDLLEDSVSEEKFRADTVLTLISTVLYEAAWENPFFEQMNTEEIFHGKDNDVEVEFMNKDTYNTPYVRGENFGSIQEYMGAAGGSMLFVLPDEGFTPEDIINSADFADYLNSKGGREASAYFIDLSVPKFDVQADLELNEHLGALGLNEIFDPSFADFSNLVEDDTLLYLSKATQSSRVMIDEKGVKAASYTRLDVDTTSGIPEDNAVDFTLDRPFIYVILSEARVPMFIGIVNQL